MLKRIDILASLSAAPCMRALAFALCTFSTSSLMAQTVDAQAQPELTQDAPAAAQEAGPETAQPPQKLSVWAFKVVGNTVLSQGDVEAAVNPFLGPDKSVETVEEARAALEQVYVDKGYTTVSVIIPEQGIRSGVFRLEVVERKIGVVTVTGARFTSEKRIKAKAKALGEGTIPNISAVEKDIVALNQLAGREITPELKQGSTPNTVDVALDVKEKLPVHGSVELNNRNSAQTSRLRLASSISYDDLWGRGDSLLISTQFAPERTNDSAVIAGGYTARIPNSLATIRLGGTYSNSDVSTIGATNVLGRGYTVGLRANLPLKGGDNFSQSLSFGLEYKNFRDETRLRLSPSDPEFVRLGCGLNPNTPQCNSSFVTPVNYVPVSLDYLASWFSDKAPYTSLGLSFVFGLRGIGSGIEEFDLKRFLARPNFWYVRANASRTQKYNGGYQISLRAQGQYTRDPLISNEGFSIGGLDSVRGYFESEALGDKGFAIQTEFSAPPIEGKFAGAPYELRVFAFSDFGYTTIYDVLPEQPASQWLASAGIGFRLRAFDALNGGLDIAWPLRDGPSTNETSEPSILFRLGVDF
jgi:hemolysin activation/secretion protein